MLLLSCPCCGVAAEETEFAPDGEAHLRREGPGSSDEEFAAYLFERANPKGVLFERWRHAHGCGKWFHVARCSVTLEVFGSYPAALPRPPEAVLTRIRDRRPGWVSPFAEDA